MTSTLSNTPSPFTRALIVGAGEGVSASLARQLRARGMAVVLASRRPEKLGAWVRADGIHSVACDASQAESVAALFEQAEALLGGAPQVVVYNVSGRVRGPITELKPDAVADVLAVSAFGGFLVAQQAARRMLAAGSGVLLFTGASASVKGFAQSAPFAMGKFALRGLAQSLARELAPQGIHVAHIVIDGGIRSATRPVPAEQPDSLLDPEAIAQSYVQLIDQPRNAWAWEIELRPWVERF
jgi:NAD(P)-dependent dehydrogenase (short-subunit alcohol dehydrogenase family)